MSMTNVLASQFIKTRDLPLAASVSLSYPVQQVERVGGNHAYFVFADTPEVNELIEKYHRKELAIEPLAFFNELKALKARLYSH